MWHLADDTWHMVFSFFFFISIFFWILLNWCYYLQPSRDFRSPVCKICFFSIESLQLSDHVVKSRYQNIQKKTKSEKFKCHASGDTCHVSRYTWHLSLMPTSTAADPPFPNSPIIATTQKPKKISYCHLSALLKKSEDSVMWPLSLHHHQGRQAAGRPRGRCVVPNPHAIMLYLCYVFTWMLCLCIVYFGLTSAQWECPHYWKELGFCWIF